MHKRNVFVVFAVAGVLILSACTFFDQEDDSSHRDDGRPDSYVEPIPVEKVEEEVIRIS
ncbi:hypothetical protein [Shouchella lonarensis]|uniref:Uncharacterized protein n=1 Tax=Shouchella lonarensis TaxID=1464122 RepID=A0A1G6J5N9_9BACI|nr:hypothetical protein [Shouchella lonarensis]SDC13605.1 hypothetical protein SAMN05421737_105251 [Shouchella lonarensis]